MPDHRVIDRENQISYQSLFCLNPCIGYTVVMHIVAEELDRKLSEMDRATAEHVERLVRDALYLAQTRNEPLPQTWPEGYFAQTAGALAGERFERPDQGTSPTREAW